MPIVTVQWLAGRTTTQKHTVAQRLAEVLAEVGEVDPREVDVIFVDVQREDWKFGSTVRPVQREAFK
jgi:4-oxalocrotonate tautomerase family enzyme